jgi:hypothetical protein
VKIFKEVRVLRISVISLSLCKEKNYNFMNNNLEFEHNLITRLVFKKENNVI